MLYLVYEAPPEEQNFGMVMDMLISAEVKEENDEYESPLDVLFARLELSEPDHLALKQYLIFKLAAGVVSCKRLIHHVLVNNTFTAYSIYGGTRNERNQNHAVV